MDNQATEPSSGALELGEAGDIFNNILNSESTIEEEKETPVTEESEPAEEVEEAEAEAETSESDQITVEVDGKKVTLTAAQIAEAYKSGLRQDDYTKKTTAVAEERKAASAEREQLAGKLNAYAAQLEGALSQQSNINWDELLEADPVQYLKESHLLQERQAALGKARQDQAQLAQIYEQEQQSDYNEYLTAQNQALLDKLPAWKDSKIATAEKGKIKDFLKSDGFSEQDISQVTDYRHVMLIQDAMKFRQLLKEAPTATKRVQNAPVRAERSGTTDKSLPDGRTVAMKRFSKSGSVEDAGAIFASLL